MDQLLSSQPMEASTPDRGTRRLSVRQAGRAGTGNTARGDSTNDVVVHTVNALGEAKLIRFPAVQERVSMGRTAVYELIKAGKFPRPVKVGAASAWIDVEITRWIQELAARRDTSNLPAVLDAGWRRPRSCASRGPPTSDRDGSLR